MTAWKKLLQHQISHTLFTEAHLWKWIQSVVAGSESLTFTMEQWCVLTLTHRGWEWVGEEEGGGQSSL